MATRDGGVERDSRNSSVVEGAVHDEEADVRVGGPRLGDDAQYADGGGYGHEHAHAEGSARVVEEEADEGDGEDTTHGKCNVEEVVDFLGFGGAVEEVGVLRADGGNEVVDTQHLEDGE